MRVAVVGANLLGCSSAFYVRQALDANRADAADGKQHPDKRAGLRDDTDEEDEIVIFDQLPRAGGHKFVTASVDGQSAAIGTAAAFDTSASPPLQDLLRAADIPCPPRVLAPDWAVLDWRADEYVVSQTRSRRLLRLADSTLACVLLQALALCLAGSFYMRVSAMGPFYAMTVLRRGRGREFDYLRLLALLLTLALGAGVVPPRYMLRVLAALQRRLVVRALSVINFGAPALAVLCALADAMREQLAQIVRHDSASSCITLGHFLSSCGFARYAGTSSAEFFAARNVPQRLLSASVAPALAAACGDSRVTPDDKANALAAQLALLGSSTMPARLRTHTARFDAAQTEMLCPAIARAARATLRLGTRVGGVTKRAHGRLYDVRDAGGASLGAFDGVLLAGVVDADEFETDAADAALRDVLALAVGSGADAGDGAGLNTARVTTLVGGVPRAHFFRTSAGGDIADESWVRGCGHVSCVARVADRVFRVSGAQMFRAGSASGEAVFSRVMQTGGDGEGARVRRGVGEGRYRLDALRDVNGKMAPNFVLGTRMLFVAMVDRVANDVSLDVLSARNAGSFFRDGVVNWKE